MFSGLRLAALLFVAISVVGALGYRLIEGFTWLEACYMTAITLSTVGFREVRPLSAGGQLFTMALLAGGLGVVLYTVVTVAEKVVEGEFQQFFGRRRMQRRIETLTSHYIVCGFGRIGEVLCRELGAKPVSFVVIDQQEERARLAEAAQYPVLHGDAAADTTLLAAGILKAKGLFAALTTDADNVFLTLTAKELNPALFVVARAETDRSERTLRRAGAEKVISPYAMGGHRMAQAALRPAVVDIIELAAHHASLELQLEEVSILPTSPYTGVALQESGFWAQPGVIVVALKRAAGTMLFHPGPAERLEAGDSIIVLAEASQLREIERQVKGS